MPSYTGEPLLLQSTIKAHESDFAHSLAYLEYAGLASPDQKFHINNGVASAREGSQTVTISSNTQANRKLPVLCAQSSNQNNASNAVATTSNEIAIKSAGNTYIGFRNQKSFRFDGIPFADPVGM